MKLKIENLTKTYTNGVKALDNISLEISSGMFGLLGPNGAGKSSLMRTLVALQEADKGSITLNNIDVLKNKNEIRKHIGYLPQEFGLYPKLNAETLLSHFAALKGIHNKSQRNQIVKDLLEKVNLYESRKKRLGGFSGGMKQRFGIAQALIGNPQMIIVDEPTAGLDPTERNRFHNILGELGHEAIIILSTHIVDDVKDLCTDMAILNNGRIVLRGNPLQTIHDLKGQVWEKTVSKAELEKERAIHTVISERLYNRQTVVRILSDYDPGDDFQQSEAHLEDVYFSQIHEKTQVTP